MAAQRKAFDTEEEKQFEAEQNRLYDEAYSSDASSYNGDEAYEEYMNQQRKRREDEFWEAREAIEEQRKAERQARIQAREQAAFEREEAARMREADIREAEVLEEAQRAAREADQMASYGNWDEEQQAIRLYNWSQDREAIRQARRDRRFRAGEVSEDEENFEESEDEENFEEAAAVPAAAAAHSHVPILRQSHPPKSRTAEDMLCAICKENEKNIAFSPCGHVCACAECADKVNSCPICRNPILSKLSVFMRKYLKYKNKYLQLKKKL